MTSNSLKRLNLGCGPTNAPADWLNVDGSWNAWFARHRYLRSTLKTFGLINANQAAHWKVRPFVHDLTRPLPFEDNAFSAVYGSHVLEHLYLTDARRLLLECKRVLRPEGVIRLVVPDLRSLAENYLKAKNGGGASASERIAPADRLNEKLAFRNPAPPGGNVFFKLYSLWKDFHHHKWMYDSESLMGYFEIAGFQEVSQKECLQSDIPGVEEVEEAERVLGGAGICIEGRKREGTGPLAH